MGVSQGPDIEYAYVVKSTFYPNEQYTVVVNEGEEDEATESRFRHCVIIKYELKDTNQAGVKYTSVKHALKDGMAAKDDVAGQLQAITDNYAAKVAADKLALAGYSG